MRRTGVTRELADRKEQCVLRWFGHMERMEEDWLVKRIVGSNVRCEIQRETKNGMDRQCKNIVE